MISPTSPVRARWVPQQAQRSPRLHQPHRAFQRLFAAVFGAGQFRGGGQVAAHRRVGPHGCVGLGLGFGQLGGGQRDAGVHPHPGGADVEPHVLRAVQAVQRAAQDMLAGMLLHGVQPCRPVDAPLHRAAHGQRRVGGVKDGLAVGMHRPHGGVPQAAGIAGLAAAFGVESGAVQHHGVAAGSRGAGQHGGGKGLQVRVVFVQFFGHGEAGPPLFSDFSHYTTKQVWKKTPKSYIIKGSTNLLPNVKEFALCRK